MGQLTEQAKPLGMKTILGAVNFAADIGGPLVGAMLHEKKRQEIGRRQAAMKQGTHPSQYEAPNAAKDYNDQPADFIGGSVAGDTVKVAPNLGDLS